MFNFGRGDLFTDPMPIWQRVMWGLVLVAGVAGLMTIIIIISIAITNL
jgi:hypothetical protein